MPAGNPSGSGHVNGATTAGVVKPVSIRTKFPINVGRALSFCIENESQYNQGKYKCNFPIHTKKIKK
jgi:hypothetical protein